MLIHKRILQVLRYATTPDDTRFALHGYGLGVDGSIAATDGHLLLYSEKPSDCPSEDYPTQGLPQRGRDIRAHLNRTLPLDAADAAVRTIKKTQAFPALDHVAVMPANGDGGGPLRVTATDLATPFQTVVDPVGPFPAWRRIIPTKVPTLTVSLGADILIDIGRAAKAAAAGSGSTGSIVTFEFTGPDDAIRLSFPCEVGHEIKGVVMPCRP